MSSDRDASPDGDSFVRVTSVDDATENTPQTFRVDGRSIGLFSHEGAFYATDNRCPHMGFPLTDGSVDDGILTCPWHHARFELSCGDTFDPFADDVRTYPVEVRGDDVYVDPDPPRDATPEEHWRDRLEHGLEENLTLVVAKSVIGLDDEGVSPTVPVRIGTAFGTHYRQDGWGSGLTTLGVTTNLLAALRPADRRRALVVGLGAVADDCAGEPPFFVQEPLSAADVPTARLTGWFRDTIEVRDADGAERVLRAAIRGDTDRSDVVAMLVAAATDHRYLDSGHRVDFVNKALETLDAIGWEHADEVLPSLVPGLAAASRAEETASWRQPIDVAGLCSDASERLPELVERGASKTWTEPAGFVDTLLGDDPHEILDALTDAIAAGATAGELADVVADVAARRVAQFGTSNEFRDWNTVHHTYTYANALCGLSRRTETPALYRGVFDGATKVYLDRFLNTPPTPLPDPDGTGDPDDFLERLGETFEVESREEVDRAGRATAAYLAAGGDVARLKRRLGEALLREDVGFHPRQNVEAAFSRYDAVAGERGTEGREAEGREAEGRGVEGRETNGGARRTDERARVHLVAAARYLAAHTPTRRAGEQTFRIAARLNRGEKIHEA